MKKIIEKIFTEGKGILAADESIPTIGKRFDAIEVENTEDNRRAWRDLLFTTGGLEKYISGVILFEKTLDQRSSTGDTFLEVLRKKGISVGVKVDGGTQDFESDESGEKITKGLEALDKNCIVLKEKGVEFTKWRAVFNINSTDQLIDRNTSDLAEYAHIAQLNGLVPIVEPEVLFNYDKILPTSEDAKKTFMKVFHTLFLKLKERGVVLEEIILKTAFVQSRQSHEITETTKSILKGMPEGGIIYREESESLRIARETMDIFAEVLPSNLGGVAFLSGGLSPLMSAEYLNETVRRGADVGFKIPITFSYGRALQSDALQVWKGDTHKVSAAKEILSEEFRWDSEASKGKWIGKQ